MTNLTIKSAAADPTSSKSSAILFISVDMVNATIFKNREKIWPLVVSKFFGLCVNEVRKRIPEANIWKYLGDEIIFFLIVDDEKKIPGFVSGTLQIIQTIQQQIHNTFPEAQGIIDLQASMWIAIVWQHPNADMTEARLFLNSVGDIDSRNIIPPEIGHSWQNPIEFLGREIDLGFRLCEYAHRQKVVISPDIAYLLYDSSNAEDNGQSSNLRCVGTRVLRGVWHNRPCPVFWYYDNWSEIGETFHYDELDTEFHKMMLEGEQTNKNRSFDLLKKIYRNNGLLGHYKNLKDVIKNPELELPDQILQQK